MSLGRNQPPGRNDPRFYLASSSTDLVDIALRTTISPTCPGLRRVPRSSTTAISKNGEALRPTLANRAGFLRFLAGESRRRRALLGRTEAVTPHRTQRVVTACGASCGVAKKITILRNLCSISPRAPISSRIGGSIGAGTKTPVTPSLTIVSMMDGIEPLVVQDDILRAAKHVRHHGLGAARPLQRVDMQVDVVPTDARKVRAEGVEVFEVVCDQRAPRAMRHNPGLGESRGPRSELDGAYFAFIPVERRIVDVSLTHQHFIGYRPTRRIRTDRHKKTHRFHIRSVRFDRRGKACVKEQDRGAYVIERTSMNRHFEVSSTATRETHCPARSTTPRFQRRCATARQPGRHVLPRDA